jgi:hypothetical protein
MAEKRVERRLAAILTADVALLLHRRPLVGYSPLAPLNLRDITDFKQCRMARIRLRV